MKGGNLSISIAHEASIVLSRFCVYGDTKRTRIVVNIAAQMFCNFLNHCQVFVS